VAVPRGPRAGPGKRGDRWYLTKRDRYTNNYGASLKFDSPEPDVDVPGDLALAAVVGPCDDEDRLGKIGPDGTHRETFEPTETLDAIVRQRYSLPSFTPWLENTQIHNLPVLPDDRPR
jgi:hypothetical protein